MKNDGPVGTPYDSMGARMSERKDVDAMTESKVDESRQRFEEVMRSVWWGDSFHAERHPKAPDEYLKAPEQMAWIGWQAAMCGPVAELIEAAGEVYRISERKHDAWDRLRAALAACTPAKEGGR